MATAVLAQLHRRSDCEDEVVAVRVYRKGTDQTLMQVGGIRHLVAKPEIKVLG